MKSIFEVYSAPRRTVRLGIKTQICGTLLMLSTSVPAFAAGTVAGTDIQNIATATFEVAGSPATLTSNTLSIKVDELLDATVAKTDDIRGWSNVFGGDFKFDISNVADIGLTGTVRIGSGRNNIAYAVGPVLTVAPFTNANITIGYNIIGFEDRDFELARYSRSGPFLTFKMKFDQTSLPGYKF